MKRKREMAEGSYVPLKLLVDTQGKKVLYAEAGKDFVDFLFHILSLPISTVVELLRGENTVGCLGNLYKSIETLSSEYLQPDVTKDSLLKPVVTCNPAVKVPLLLLDNDAPNTTTPCRKKFYRCQHTSDGYFISCKNYVSDGDGAVCPNCKGKMFREMIYVAPEGSTAALSSDSTVTTTESGYVKGLVTYMVMDNLEVKPLSTISGITLLNKLHVKDVTCLVEKDVQIGLTEGVALLEASFQTKGVLTSVFL